MRSNLEGGPHGGTTQQIWCNSQKPEGLLKDLATFTNLAICKCSQI